MAGYRDQCNAPPFPTYQPRLPTCQPTLIPSCFTSSTLPLSPSSTLWPLSSSRSVSRPKPLTRYKPLNVYSISDRGSGPCACLPYTESFHEPRYRVTQAPYTPDFKKVGSQPADFSTLAATVNAALHRFTQSPLTQTPHTAPAANAYAHASRNNAASFKYRTILGLLFAVGEPFDDTWGVC